MKVSFKKDTDLKIVTVVKDLSGERFSSNFAEKLFALEDQGFELQGSSKETTKKLHNMRVAFYRVKK